MSDASSAAVGGLRVIEDYRAHFPELEEQIVSALRGTP
jgi:hypothetical protein